MCVKRLDGTSNSGLLVKNTIFSNLWILPEFLCSIENHISILSHVSHFRLYSFHHRAVCRILENLLIEKQGSCNVCTIILSIAHGLKKQGRLMYAYSSCYYHSHGTGSAWAIEHTSFMKSVLLSASAFLAFSFWILCFSFCSWSWLLVICLFPSLRWMLCWTRQFVLCLVCSLDHQGLLLPMIFCGFGRTGDLHHFVTSIYARVNCQISSPMMSETDNGGSYFF